MRRLLFNAYQYDSKDATSIKVEVPNFSEDCESSEFEHVVGLVSDLIHSFGDEDLSKNYGEAIERLEKLKIKTKEIELPNLELSLPVYYVIALLNVQLTYLDMMGSGLDTELRTLKISKIYILNLEEKVLETKQKKDTYRNLLLIFRIL